MRQAIRGCGQGLQEPLYRRQKSVVGVFGEQLGVRFDGGRLVARAQCGDGVIA